MSITARLVPGGGPGAGPRRRLARWPLLLASLGVVVGGVQAIAIHATAGAAPGGPTYVQQVGGHAHGAGSIAVTPGSAVAAGDRLVVEVGVWSGSSATTSAVTDNAGDPFVLLLRFTAADHTEMTVWTAPVSGGAGLRPAITATASGAADLGIVALEYAGLATVADASVVDTAAHAAGTTGSAGSVSSGATGSTSAANEVALGLYLDSGFGAALAPGAGSTQRANISPTSDMELLAEDQLVGAGATPASSAGTGASTVWLMATVVLQSGQQLAPGAPSTVAAIPGDSSATVSWTAPASHGSPITSYTVTPSAGGTALAPTVVSGSPPATTAAIASLVDGTGYTFTVTATNANGTGPASVPSNLVYPSTVPLGQWGSPQPWPIVALSSSLLHNGKLVTWDGWQQPQPSVVWDPANPQNFTTVNAPDSVFCDGGASLPDGRLLVIGGFGHLTTGQLGIVDTNIFDPATSSWQRVANMHLPRWYPTVTELADGRYVAVSGNSTDGSHWADTPEVYDPTANTWTLLSKVSTPQVHELEYPFSYLVPNGHVFTIGPAEDNSFQLDVANQTWSATGGQSGIMNGSSIMYQPGKILYTGGAASVSQVTPAQSTSAVIDLTAATPTWRPATPMSHARIYHTLTMLADGRVFAVGGAPTSNQQTIAAGVLPTEIWDPASQTWTDAAPISAARNYHSSAVLLPDGRVFVAGGGHPEGLGDPGQFSSQIYSPSYLSNGPRPTITSAPSSASYGSALSVATPDAASVRAVNLVSLGADTHQIDMNQHFVPLGFTAGSGSLSIHAPASPALAPPGYYMLFILNDKGVPSTASIVNIGGQSQTVTPPAAPTGVTATAGTASATVNWTAPPDGNSPITSYSVTPYAGSVAQTPTVVTGNPPAPSAAISGLTNATTYTFVVTATNAAGTGPPSTASNPVTPGGSATGPAFVQQAGTYAAGVGSVAATPAAPLTAGNRMVVEVGAWSPGHATASAVTDSAGNSYVEVSHSTASDGTEMSIWTAPVGTGGPVTVTATASANADLGVTALEYSGLSTANDATAVDQQAQATGTTAGATTVRSGPTAPTSPGNSLALGFYADSGFGNALTTGPGFGLRSNLSPNAHMDLLAEDQPAGPGATPNAAIGTGPGTVWLAATVVFKPSNPGPPAVPGPPTTVTAVAGNAAATVSWTAPPNGGSPVTLYTVTPYLAGTPLTATTVAGSPPLTSALVTGLTNGSAYTFTVSATNAVGPGPASPPSVAVTPTASPPPAFLQQVSAHGPGRSSITVTPAAALGSGNRLVVAVAGWNPAGVTTSAVTDSTGDSFVELTHFTASDKTEMSIWTAAVTAGAGRRPVITARPDSTADLGIVALEYSGLSAAPGAAAVDRLAAGTGRTAAAQSVSSGAAPATTGGNELAIGFYADSGFGATLTADPGYAARANPGPAGDIELLAEDTPVGLGATPAASAGTAANTVWLMVTVVFKHA